MLLLVLLAVLTAAQPPLVADTKSIVHGYDLYLLEATDVGVRYNVLRVSLKDFTQPPEIISTEAAGMCDFDNVIAQVVCFQYTTPTADATYMTISLPRGEVKRIPNIRHFYFSYVNKSLIDDDSLASKLAGR